MQNHTENTINSVPSNQVDISDNEDINYQINTTESKNQNTNNANPPYQKSSASSDNVDFLTPLIVSAAVSPSFEEYVFF